jgi:hypothetical protein
MPYGESLVFKYSANRHFPLVTGHDFYMRGLFSALPCLGFP